MGTESALKQALERLCDEHRQRQEAKLPSERALAERLRCSRNAVRKILNQLEAEGVVYRVLGRAGGAFLSDVPVLPPRPQGIPSVNDGHRLVNRDLNHPIGVPKMLTSQGYSSSTKVISAKIETASPEASAAFGGCMEAISIVRTRYADGEALSLEHMYLPLSQFPDLLKKPLDSSVYELLENEYDTEIARVKEFIEVTLAPSSVAENLDCAVSSPLLKLTRQSWDQNNECVEFSVDLFRADRTRLVFNSE